MRRSASRLAQPRAPFWLRVGIAFIGLMTLIGVLQGFVFLAFLAMEKSLGGLR